MDEVSYKPGRSPYIIKRILSLLILLPVFHIAIAQSHGLLIDSTLSALAAKYENGYAGLGIGIVHHHRIIYQKGFGYADKKKRIPCTDTTVMEVASISKAIVGMAVAKLVEMKYCTLDSPVNSLLPFPIINPRSPERPITLRQVVTHTSGIHDSKLFFWRTMQYSELKDPDVSLKDFVFHFLSPAGKWYSRNSFRLTSPSADPDYSNLNAAVAAVVIESLTKMPFTEFTQKNIFDPLGMSHTGWQFKQLKEKQVAQKYTRHGVRLRHYTIRSYPSSTLYTTVADMNKVMELMLNNDSSHQVFSSDTAIRFLTGYHESKNEYGVFWKHYGEQAGHSGSNLGIAARLRISSAKGNGYILIFNQTMQGRNARIEDELIKYLDRINSQAGER